MAYACMFFITSSTHRERTENIGIGKCREMTVCLKHQRMLCNTVSREREREKKICLCTIRQVKVISPAGTKSLFRE